MIVPRFTQEQSLILTDSEIESVLATAMASEQQAIGGLDPSVLCPAWWEMNSEELDLLLPILESSVTQQSQIFGLKTLAEQPFYPLESAGTGKLDHRAHQTRILMEAAYLTMQLGIKHLIWPVRIPESHPNRIKAIGDTIDRCMLISRLVSIDASRETAPEVVIETPFVDLSDEQIFELALDMALPTEMCWWSQAADSSLAQRRAQEWQRISSTRSAILEPKPAVKTPT